MAKKIRLKCTIGAFSGGDIVEVGNGEGQLPTEVFDTLDKHHFEKVEEQALVSQKKLKGELESATRELDKLRTENNILKQKDGSTTDKVAELETEKQTLSSEKGVLAADVERLTTENSTLKTDGGVSAEKITTLETEKQTLFAKIEELVASIKALNANQAADKLKAAVKKLQEGV